MIVEKGQGTTVNEGDAEVTLAMRLVQNTLKADQVTRGHLKTIKTDCASLQFVRTCFVAENLVQSERPEIIYPLEVSDKRLPVAYTYLLRINCHQPEKSTNPSTRGRINPSVSAEFPQEAVSHMTTAPRHKRQVSKRIRTTSVNRYLAINFVNLSAKYMKNFYLNY